MTAPRLDHSRDAAPHAVVRINLQRTLSIAAFNACVHDALINHPDKRLQREARRRFAMLEKEIGFDIKVISLHPDVLPAPVMQARHHVAITKTSETAVVPTVARRSPRTGGAGP